jgi:hypothetical protein
MKLLDFVMASDWLGRVIEDNEEIDEELLNLNLEFEDEADN